MHDLDDTTERIRATLQQADLHPGPPHRCPYLPDQSARTVAFLAARLPSGVYRALMNLNFRRSGTLLYRPTCETCRQCRMCRVIVREFRPNRTQRRCRYRNADLAVTTGPPEPTEEKHLLFRRYLRDRHDGEMGESWDDFRRFLYESPVDTMEVVYRVGNRLAAVGIADVEPGAASTVYCYFDPTLASRSLGTFNVLWMIDWCRVQGHPHLYLGYYIRDCGKMSYKIGFRPCEMLEDNERWRRVD